MKRIIREFVKGISLSINGIQLDVEPGTSIYEASREILDEKSMIPTICYHPYLSVDGSCGVCAVELEGNDGQTSLVSSCVTECQEGMVVRTDTPEVNDNIKSVLRFLLSSHPLECGTCFVSGSCRFQDLIGKYKVKVKSLDEEQTERYNKIKNSEHSDRIFGNNVLKLDGSKCLKCSRCVRACAEITEQFVLTLEEVDGVKQIKVNEDDLTLCTTCGQCQWVCPTGAITINTDVDIVEEWLSDPEIIVVGQTAPAVRITMSETFGKGPGEMTEGQICEGMRQIGFDYVFDTNFTADLTIMEEGYELIDRITNGGPFPMFTSCCPAWVNMAESCYPEYLENLSSCRSPQQMMGSLIKNFWVEREGLDPSKVKSVSIMPCVAKKGESQREQMRGDVDVALTVTELSKLFKNHKVKGPKLGESPLDNPFGDSTGAGTIFGATGGVMEAALRTAYEVLTGEPIPEIDYKPARGLEGVKESEIEINGTKIKIAVVHQGKNIHKLMKKIKEGETYHFIEIMMCPGGCVGGAGNPSGNSNTKPQQDFLSARIKSIYSLDEKMELRKSHLNPSIIKLYDEFLDHPASSEAHHLLHTHYNPRK